MALTRAYDERMFRAQRQGKTSFYMKSTGEEAVAVAAAFALDRDDMCFPSYRQQGLLIARDWDMVDMMNQEIGRAHVTPVTNAHLVCRLLLEKKKLNSRYEQLSYEHPPINCICLHYLSIHHYKPPVKQD